MKRATFVAVPSPLPCSLRSGERKIDLRHGGEHRTSRPADVFSMSPRGPDVASSKFQEWDVWKGVRHAWPGRLFSRSRDSGSDLRGQNVQQLTNIHRHVSETDWFAMNADVTPSFTASVTTVAPFLTQQSPGVWVMSDTLQAAFRTSGESTPTANRIFTSFAAAVPALHRRRARASTCRLPRADVGRRPREESAVLRLTMTANSATEAAVCRRTIELHAVTERRRRSEH